MRQNDTKLIIDTALGACNIALKTPEAVHINCKIMAFGQAEHLIPMIEELLETHKQSYQDLNAIITTTGPGGFTGLRVGISTARALALALNIPLYGLNTFEALIGGTPDAHLKETNCIIIDSKRDELFYQTFGKDKKPLNEPQLGTLDEILSAFNKDTLFISNLDNVSGIHIECADLEQLAAFLNKNSNLLEENPEPLYMRGADVSAPKKKQRVLKS